MFCINCGKQVDDNANFCHHCGAQPTVSVTPTAATSAVQSAPTTPMQANPVTKVSDKKATPRLIVGLAVAVAIIALVAGWMVNTKTIHLGDYIVFEQETGYDGYGTITASFDSEAFKADYAGKLQVETSALAGDDSLEYKLLSAWSSADDDVAMDFFMEFVSGSLDQRSSLSNGDVVTWIWRYAEELSSYFNYKVDASDVAYSISLLEEVATFDAFENVSVRFSGYDGYGTASLSVRGSLSHNNYSTSFSISKITSLSNGDVITVTFDGGDELSLLEDLGALPASTTATYEVSGLEATREEDIFQYITVSFSGLNGEGYPMITTTGGLSADYFTISKESGLSNGDTITLILQSVYLVDLAENFGIIPTETSATYTVEGLYSRVTSAEDTSTSFFNMLMSTCEDIIQDYADTSWDSEYQYLEDITYIQSYSPEDSTTLYMIFSFVIHEYEPDNNMDDSHVNYYWISFSNLIMDSNGDYSSGLDDYDTVPNRYILYVSGSDHGHDPLYYGYQDLDDLLIDLP